MNNNQTLPTEKTAEKTIEEKAGVPSLVEPKNETTPVAESVVKIQPDKSDFVSVKKPTKKKLTKRLQKKKVKKLKAVSIKKPEKIKTGQSSKFKKIRMQLGMSQMEVALKLGICQAYVSLMEAGKQKPTDILLVKYNKLAKKVKK